MQKTRLRSRMDDMGNREPVLGRRAGAPAVPCLCRPERARASLGW